MVKDERKRSRTSALVQSQHDDALPLLGAPVAFDRLHTDRLATLGELAARAAHDINGQLMGAHHGLNTARHIARAMLAQGGAGGDAERLSRALADVDEAVSRVTTITQDMTLYARPPSGNPGPVQIQEVVRDALRVTSCLLENHVNVVQRVPPIVVRGVPGLLVQLLVNLLINAAHALAGRTGSTLTIEARTDGQTLRLCVRDDGAGVPTELRARIFEPYFTTKPAGVGTGLGLAICQEIAEGHGGSISLLDTEEPGTCFEVVLPLWSQGQ
ncbi:MAG: sensor histidine kinase [Polyangiales bacterium]